MRRPTSSTNCGEVGSNRDCMKTDQHEVWRPWCETAIAVKMSFSVINSIPVLCTAGARRTLISNGLQLLLQPTSRELHFEPISPQFLTNSILNELPSWQFLERSYSFTATPYSLESHSIVTCPRHTRQEEHFWNKQFTKSRSTVVYVVPTNFRCRAHSENTQFAIGCRDRGKFCCFLLCTTLNDIQVRLG